MKPAVHQSVKLTKAEQPTANYQQEYLGQLFITLYNKKKKWITECIFNLKYIKFSFQNWSASLFDFVCDVFLLKWVQYEVLPSFQSHKLKLLSTAAKLSRLSWDYCLQKGARCTDAPFAQMLDCKMTFRSKTVATSHCCVAKATPPPPQKKQPTKK